MLPVVIPEAEKAIFFVASETFAIEKKLPVLPSLTTIAVRTVVVPVAPATDEPMLMLVMEPEIPEPPILIVFVVALAVAPVAKLYVEAPVEPANMFTVCAPVATLPIARVVAAPKALTVVAVVLKTSMEELPVVTLVAKNGVVAVNVIFWKAAVPVAPEVAEPKLILVTEVDTPPVPILITLVVLS